MRGFTGAACSDVTHADRGDFAFADLEYAVVVQGVPQLQGEIIWCQNDLVKHRMQRYEKLQAVQLFYLPYFAHPLPVESDIAGKLFYIAWQVLLAFLAKHYGHI